MEYVLIVVVLVVIVLVISARKRKEEEQTELTSRDNIFVGEALKEGMSAVATAQMAAELNGVENVPYNEPEKYERARGMMMERPEVTAVVLTIACGLARKYSQSNGYREFKTGLLENVLQSKLADVAGIDADRLQSLRASIPPGVRDTIETEAFEADFQFTNGIRRNNDEALGLLSAIESIKSR